MITSESEITETIDWLSFTSNHEILLPIPDQRYKETKTGMMHYSSKKTYLSGMISLWHEDRPEMGFHHILSGTALRNLRSSGVDVFLFLRTIAREASVARLDICVDLKHGKLEIELLSELLVQGDCETRAKEGHFRKQLMKEGETLYIGSPKSDTLLRIYDKRHEQGTDFDWTRVECQYRHGRARAVTRTLTSLKSPQKGVGGIIKAFADFPTIPDWCAMLGNHKIVPGKDEKYKSNRRKWLLETAAKALSSEMLVDDKILNELVIEAVRLHAEKELEMMKN